MRPLNNLLREEDMKVIFGGIKVSSSFMLNWVEFGGKKRLLNFQSFELYIILMCRGVELVT
jgi:hypothetical protein